MTSADELLRGEIQDAGDKFHLLIERINLVTDRRTTLTYIANQNLARAEALHLESKGLAANVTELVRQVKEINDWLSEAYDLANEYIEQAKAMNNLLGNP